MPTNNQPAKSYITTVLARADGATPLPDTGHSQACGCPECSACWQRGAKFQAEARGLVVQDIPTLARIALRAIDVLKFITEESDCDREADDRVKDACWAALADINALAAKGSQ